jgi:hypothetical protein
MIKLKKVMKYRKLLCAACLHANSDRFLILAFYWCRRSFCWCLMLGFILSSLVYPDLVEAKRPCCCFAEDLPGYG